MPRLRLAFMGTPEFAVPALAALIKAGHDIASVYCRPPRPAGRGYKLQPAPVHLFAESRSLPVRTPESLDTPGVQADFVALDVDAAVVVAFGLILPKAILATPRLGCLNIHASLLPRWRGAAPIQRAILAGDTETGVTIMQMDEGLDTGPVLLQERVPIRPSETAATLHDRLAALGARLIVEALDGVATGKLEPRPQPRDGVTYAAKLTREEARLDWRKPAAELERQVRAFDPWPGAWLELPTDMGAERIRVLQARVNGTCAGAPGTVRPGSLVVCCGDGLGLELQQVQRAGRKAMTAPEFLRGFPLPHDTVLP